MNADRLLSGAYPWQLRQNLRRVRVNTRVDMGAVNYKPSTYTPLAALLQPSDSLTATVTSVSAPEVGSDMDITLSDSDAAAAYGYTAGDASLVGHRITAVSTADNGYLQGTIKSTTAGGNGIVVTVTVTAVAGAMAPSTTLRLAHVQDQLFLDRPKQSTTAANNLLRNVFMETGRAHSDDTMTFVLVGQHADGSIGVDRASTVELETDIDIAISESVGVGSKFTVYTTDATHSGLDSDAVATDYHRLAKFTITGGVNAGTAGYHLKIQEDDSDIADPDAVADNHDVVELFEVSYSSSTETTTGYLGIRDSVAARSATMKSSVWLTARDDRDMNTQYTFTVRYCAPPTLDVVLNTDDASYIHDDNGTAIPAVLKGSGDQAGSESVVADLTLSGTFGIVDDRSYIATVPGNNVFKFIDNSDGTLDLAFNPSQAQQVHDTGTDAYTVTLTDHGRATDFHVNGVRARLFGSVSGVTVAVPPDANFVYVTEAEFTAGGAIELGGVAIDVNDSGESTADIGLTSTVGSIVDGKVQVNANTAGRSGSLTTVTVGGTLAGVTAQSGDASVLQTDTGSFDFGLRRNPALSVAISSAAIDAETLKLKSGDTYVFEDPDTQANNEPIMIATVEVTNGRLTGGDTTTITHAVAGVTVVLDDANVYKVLIDPEVATAGQVALDAISETSGFQVVETIDGAGGVDSDRTAAVATNALFNAKTGLSVIFYAGDPDLQVSRFRSRTYDDYTVGSGSLGADSTLATIATYRIHDTYVTNVGGVLSIPELRLATLSSAAWNPTEAENNPVPDTVVGVANITDAQDGLHYTFDLVLKSTTGLHVSRDLAAADNHIWAYLTTFTADEATTADRAAGFAIEIVQPPTFTATAASATTTYNGTPAFESSSGTVDLYTVTEAAGVLSLPSSGFSKGTDTDNVCDLSAGTIRFNGDDDDKNQLLQAARVTYADFGISNLAAAPTVGSRAFDIGPPSPLTSGFFVYKPLSLSLTPPAFPAGSSYTLQSHGSVYAVVASAVAESVADAHALRTTVTVSGGLGDYTLSLNIGSEADQTYTASVAGTTSTFYLRDDDLAPTRPSAGQTAVKASDTITIEATDQDLGGSITSQTHGSLRVFAPLELVTRDADDNSDISGQMNVYMAAGANVDNEIAVQAPNLFRGGAWYMASTMSGDTALVAMSQGGKLQLTPTVTIQGGQASTALDMDDAEFHLTFNGDTSGLSVGTTNYGVIVEDQVGSSITAFDSERWLSMRVYDDVTVTTVSSPVFKNSSDRYAAFTVSATYAGGAPRGADGSNLRDAFSVAAVTGLTVTDAGATVAVTATAYDHAVFTDNVTMTLTPNASAAASVFAGGVFRLTLTAAAITLGSDEYVVAAGSNPTKGSSGSTQLAAPATAYATLTFVDSQPGTANQAAAIFGDNYNAFLSGNADEYYLSNFGESDDPAINAVEINGTPSTLVDGSSTTLSRGGTGALLINYGALNDNSSRLALLHFQAPPTMPHAFMMRVENADGTHNTSARFYVANTNTEGSDGVITATGASDDDQFFVGDIFGSDKLDHASVATNGYAAISKANNKFISVDVSGVADASVVHLVVYAVNDGATGADDFGASLELGRIQAYVRQTGDLLGVDVPRDILATSTFRDNDYTWSDHGSLVVPYSSIRMEPSSTSAAAFTFDVQVWAKKPGLGETTYHNLTDVLFARESEFAVGAAPTATGSGSNSYVRFSPGSGNLFALKNLPERFMAMTSPSPFTADSSSQEWNTDGEANPNVITYRLALRKVETGAVPNPQQWVYQEFEYKRASDINADLSSIVRSTSSNFKAASGGSAFNVQFLPLTSSASTIIGYYAKQMNSAVQSFQQVIVNQMSKVSAMMAAVSSGDTTPRTLADWLTLFNGNEQLAARELYEDNVFFARGPGDSIGYNASAETSGGTHDYAPDEEGAWSIVRIAPEFN